MSRPSCPPERRVFTYERVSTPDPGSVPLDLTRHPLFPPPSFSYCNSRSPTGDDYGSLEECGVCRRVWGFGKR